MKAVIQRVKNAVLSVGGNEISKIEKGLVVYFCVEVGDEMPLCQKFANKLVKLRIFADNSGKTNLSVADVGGSILFVSQFTLAADLNGGNRPSFIFAEKPDIANAMYLHTAELIKNMGIPVQKGVFGADMTIVQANDGPFTIIWDSEKNK